ncbi:MAG: hypothetical protein M0C28_33560 [Candidatus Moduliflexus flocculans]|nr:hypothetical protein [Candidatus Moduliflexus flocculans]
MKFSNRVLRRFAETVAKELGSDQFNAMLSLSKFPADWSTPWKPSSKWTRPARRRRMPPCKPPCAPITGAARAACSPAWDERLWRHLLKDAALGSKTQAAIIKRLPLSRAPQS